MTVVETDTMAAARAAMSDPARIFPVNGVPSSPPYPYGVLSATIGRGDTYTLDANHGLRWGRVTAQTFGKTADSALVLMEQLSDDLLDVALAITGYETTKCRAELDPRVLRDPNDTGVVGVTASWTFTATKEA